MALQLDKHQRTVAKISIGIVLIVIAVLVSFKAVRLRLEWAYHNEKSIPFSTIDWWVATHSNDLNLRKPMAQSVIELAPGRSNKQIRIWLGQPEGVANRSGGVVVWIYSLGETREGSSSWDQESIPSTMEVFFRDGYVAAVE